MRKLLDERKDLRIALAVVLYNENKISLGKAVEIAGVSYDDIKKILAEKLISRKSGAGSVKELDEELKNIRK
jgi:predicted HTH domain antitoxin